MSDTIINKKAALEYLRNYAEYKGKMSAEAKKELLSRMEMLLQRIFIDIALSLPVLAERDSRKTNNLKDIFNYFEPMENRLWH